MRRERVYRGVTDNMEMAIAGAVGKRQRRGGAAGYRRRTGWGVGLAKRGHARDLPALQTTQTVALGGIDDLGPGRTAGEVRVAHGDGLEDRLVLGQHGFAQRSGSGDAPFERGGLKDMG